MGVFNLAIDPRDILAPGRQARCRCLAALRTQAEVEGPEPVDAGALMAQVPAGKWRQFETQTSNPKTFFQEENPNCLSRFICGTVTNVQKGTRTTRGPCIHHDEKVITVPPYATLATPPQVWVKSCSLFYCQACAHTY